MNKTIALSQINESLDPIIRFARNDDDDRNYTPETVGTAGGAAVAAGLYARGRKIPGAVQPGMKGVAQTIRKGAGALQSDIPAIVSRARKVVGLQSRSGRLMQLSSMASELIEFKEMEEEKPRSKTEKVQRYVGEAALGAGAAYGGLKAHQAIMEKYGGYASGKTTNAYKNAARNLHKDARAAMGAHFDEAIKGVHGAVNEGVKRTKEIVSEAATRGKDVVQQTGDKSKKLVGEISEQVKRKASEARTSIEGVPQKVKGLISKLRKK